MRFFFFMTVIFIGTELWRGSAMSFGEGAGALGVREPEGRQSVARGRSIQVFGNLNLV